MNTSVTLKDLANVLGLSTSTVSKALNNSTEISNKTKIRVKEIADIYDYRPNGSAYSLRSKRTRTLGIIVPELGNLLYANMLEGITYEATKQQYRVMVYTSSELYKKEADYVRLLSDGSVDGWLICPALETLESKIFDHLFQIQKKGEALVVLDRTVNDVMSDRVISNIADCSHYITGELLEAGKYRFACLLEKENPLSDEIKAGMEKAFKNTTGNVEVHTLESTENDMLLRSFLQSVTFDVLITSNEENARKAIQLNREINAFDHNTPMVVFNGNQLKKWAVRNTITVVQNGYYMGREGARLLFERMEVPYSQRPPVTKVIRARIHWNLKADREERIYPTNTY